MTVEAAAGGVAAVVLQELAPSRCLAASQARQVAKLYKKNQYRENKSVVNILFKQQKENIKKSPKCGKNVTIGKNELMKKC